jgi:hypothetical protein
MPRRLPARVYKVADDVGLVRILEALGTEERRAVAARHPAGGIILLRGALRGVVERLNERKEAAEIETKVRKLCGHRPLLRKHGIDIDTIRHRAPTVYSDEMLAGNVIPEGIYRALTGKLPNVAVNGDAVHFVVAVMHELGIEYSAEGVVKAMQRYKLAERNRALMQGSEITPSSKKNVADKHRTRK